MDNLRDGSPVLTPRFAAQDERFARAFAIIQKAIAERAFPGAALAVSHRGELVAWKAFGSFTYDASSPPVSPNTPFDLASLTKVLATTPMAMALYERGQLDLDAPVVELLPLFDNPQDPLRRLVTVGMLLAHSSGLPGYVKFYQQARTRDELIALAMQVPLEAAPMTRAEYSDIGFLLLGLVLEKLAGEPLDSFCAREIVGPYGMSTACFIPPEALRAKIPPTLDDRDCRRRVVQGEVNDENASVMGGVGGHAGLFASVFDVAIFAHRLLCCPQPVFRPETIALFTERQQLPPGASRALGWDTPSQPSQSGRHFSPRAFGHLGYTGTSLWCDPERQLSVSLLTNRTWPDGGTQAIKQVRPLLHDAIVEALTGERA